MLTNISPQILQSYFPHFNIINLAIDGSCANDVLRDIAEDDTFKGIVVCDITTKCMLFSCKDEVDVNSFIRYYHSSYNLNSNINRTITTLIQKNFCVVDPSVSLIKILGQLIKNKALPPSRYWTTHENRSQSINYSKVLIDEYRADRLNKVKTLYDNLHKDISLDLFKRKINDINNWANKIKARGGQVIFIYFPVSEDHWFLDERYFPKNTYWNTFAAFTNAETMHFKDLIELDSFKLPDSSHLDYRDRPAFTKIVAWKLLHNFTVLKQEDFSSAQKDHY